jgi:hypothetical protein
VTSPSFAFEFQDPYPGLRPFRYEDSHLFFGREENTQDLLDRLEEHRFLAVVGNSGCGKSSLVRAGLMPALERGALNESTSSWRFAAMLPGDAPLASLSRALSVQARLGTESACRAELDRSAMGLSRIARGLEPNESLFLLVDQFEELFRERSGEGSQEETRRFVDLLLAAADRALPRVYVVLTMRYEYFTDCARFRGLPEAMNEAQYLVPRLTRDQKRVAIEAPARLAGDEVSPVLAETLLNDFQEDADLPLLQHVLARSYRRFRRSRTEGQLVGLDHYREVKGKEALDAHARELKGEDPEESEVLRRIFSCLTVVDPNGRQTRRRTRLGTLREVVGAPDALVTRLVERFAQPEASFLTIQPSPLNPDSLVDLTHECLIERWQDLRTWTHDERRKADAYMELAAAVRRHEAGEAGLWQGLELKSALQSRPGWNPAWAAQYVKNPPMDRVVAFLERSRNQERMEKGRRRLVWALGVLAVLLTLWGLDQWRQRSEAQSAARDAAESAKAALEKYREAERSKTLSDTELARLRVEARTRELGAQDPRADPRTIQFQVRAEEAERQLALLRNELKTRGEEPRPSNTASGNEDLVRKNQDLAARADRLQSELAERNKQIAALESRTREPVTAATPGSVAPPGSALAELPARMASARWTEVFLEAQKQKRENRPALAAALFYLAISKNKDSRARSAASQEFDVDYFPFLELAELYERNGNRKLATEWLSLENEKKVLESESRSRLLDLKQRLNASPGSGK